MKNWRRAGVSAVRGLQLAHMETFLCPQSTASWYGRPVGRAIWWSTAAWNLTWACCASTPGFPPPW